MVASYEYLSILRPKHGDFIATMTMEEKRVMERHFAYTKRLFEQGKIILGGAATDGAIGILVLRVESEEEAHEIFDNDPAVKAGIGYPELHPFRIGLFSCSQEGAAPT
ncbi:MAG: YciI family protein [Methanomicrobiales archaeon]|nr:YciI family protein [Methanomicrobiales archaeon]